MDSFENDQGNLLKVVDRALAATPDLIFAPVYYPEAAAIINRLAEQGSSVALLGGDGWESPELFRLSGQNIKSGQVFISSHFSLQYPQQTGSSFVQDFHKKFGDTPNALSALGFDAVGVLTDALRRATAISRKETRVEVLTFELPKKVSDYYIETNLSYEYSRPVLTEEFISIVMARKVVNSRSIR